MHVLILPLALPATVTLYIKHCVHSPPPSHSFLSPQSPSGVVMKALGLLVNLTQDGEETESLMVDHGAALLGILVSLLQDDSSEERSDQVVCLLVNLSGCSAEKVKDILAGCDDLMRAAARILVSSLLLFASF